MATPGNVPLDWDVLYGQLYLVDGTSTKRYPNSSNVYEALTANNNAGGIVTGRTVAAFADRILYGWVLDGTEETPERVAYSEIFNGGSHLVASGAGDFDLLDTPGGVVKLITLTEDVCAALKEVGIYSLRRTGNAAAPIIRDVIDFDTGCLAAMTAQRVNNQTGNPIILFFGFNKSYGYNIYAFDGTQVTPAGDGIQDILTDNVNREHTRNSFAVLDPEAGLYWLFVARGTDIFPTGGVVMSIRTGAWSEFELPFPVSSGGIWTPTARVVEHAGRSADHVFGDPRRVRPLRRLRQRARRVVSRWGQAG